MDGEKKRPRRKTSTSERKASRKSRSGSKGSISSKSGRHRETSLPPYDPKRPSRKTLSGATRRETDDSLQVSNSGTELAIAQNPRLSAVSSIPVDLGAVVSQRKLQEAERLLHQMSAPALLQLKRLLRGKADAVQRDLALLEENETTLCELGTKLQEEKSTLEDDKCRLSEQLTMMRDNLCKVTNFSCQIFELRGGAVMEETVTDQWTERADMLQKMERMIAKGIEEDAKVTKEFEAAEKDWQKLMLEYAGYEQQIVAAHNRRGDLQNQIRNYEELFKQQESQLRELKLLRKEHGDEMSNRAAGIALLRQKVIEQLGPEYSLDRVDKVITGHQQFEHDLEETLVEVQALVMQVEATDEIRQHALEVVLEKAQKPGHHGVDENIWAEIVRTSIKASETGLKARVADLTDMVQFKEKALAQLLGEKDDVRSVEEKREVDEADALPEIPSDYWSPDD